MRHLTFSNPLDEKLMDMRESAIRELARSLDMPADVMLGLGDVNHWSAWQIEESGIKIHVSPKAETVVHGLTKGYLIPTLRAAEAELVGPNGGRLIVWYDTSEITQRPDRSENIIQAYDRYEVNGTALRREIGADDEDVPTQAEFKDMVLKRAAKGDQGALTILSRLEGTSEPEQPVPPSDGDSEPDDEGETEQPDRSPPDTRDEPPPPPDDDQPASVRRSVLVPAGTAHENRATRTRRNGARTEQPVE
jgi:hypothetical protein